MKRKHARRAKKSLKPTVQSPVKASVKAADAGSPQGKPEENVENQFLTYFSDTERVSHDLHIEHVTDERFRSARDFIRACEAVGIYRLKQGELTDDAGFHLGELAVQMAHAIQSLIKRGDLMLARRLPVIIEILNCAFSVYGPKLTSRVTKNASIHKLLKQHKAKELLAMLSALHPDWHTFILHIYHPKLRMRLDHAKDEKQRIECEKQRLDILLRKRRCVEAFSETRLRRYILSKERFLDRNTKPPTEEWRRHGLAVIIETMFTLRGGEKEKITLFVENLFRGRLWSLGRGATAEQPGKTYVDCPWKGSKVNPPLSNTRAWMKLVMPFLIQVTHNDPMRLHVFERLLATRKFVYHDSSGKGHGRLATDSAKQVWNQLGTEIRKVWVMMAKRASKPSSTKLA